MANDILAARTKYVAEMFAVRNSAGLKLAYRWAIRREIAKIRELRQPQKG